MIRIYPRFAVVSGQLYFGCDCGSTRTVPVDGRLESFPPGHGAEECDLPEQPWEKEDERADQIVASLYTSNRVIYIFTDRCMEDLGDEYDGYAEGPANFDFTELRERYWTIIHARHYKPDGSIATLGDSDYELPPHPGYFGDFIIAENSEFRSIDMVKVIGS